MLRDLETSTLAELVDERIAEGNSGGTINRELALVQAVLRYAKLRKYELPREEIDFSELKQDEGEGKLRWFTVPEERLLLDVLDGRVRKHGGLIAQDQLDLTIFALDTGARYHEIALLPWDCVDFERGVINVYRSKVGNEGSLALTGRLREVLERRQKATGDRRYIFPAGHGKKWAADDKPRGYATSGIRSALDEAGLNAPHLVERYGRATFHTTRHTFASRLVQAGVSLYKVQKLLGHASPKMTMRYAKLAPDAAATEAAQVLDRVRMGAPVSA
jgi:integrase